MIEFDGEERYFFQYAPPSLGHRETSSSKRPGKPFSEAEGWQCSVYYYWWKFLRLSKDYENTCEAGGGEKCAALYLDFGDVRDDDFQTWWMARGRELFREPPHTAAVVIAPDAFSFQQAIRVGDRLPIVVERYGDVERTLFEVRELLRQYAPGGPTGRKASKARYPVFARPELSAIHTHYEAYRLCEVVKMDGYKAYRELGLTGAQDYEPDDLDWGDGYNPNDDPAWRQSAGKVVDKHLRIAKRMIKYVRYGLFPVLTKKNEAEARELLLERGEVLD